MGVTSAGGTEVRFEDANAVSGPVAIISRHQLAMDELEQIGIVLEDGFVDIDLPLAAFGRDEAGVQEVVASGLHQGGRVGFKVRLEASWERQALEGGAIGSSTGAEPKSPLLVPRAPVLRTPRSALWHNYQR